MDKAIKHIFAGFDPNEAVQLLQKLIRLDTVNPPGNEDRITMLLAELGRHEGLDVTLDRLADNRSNLILKSTHRSDSHKTMIFSGHTDTVPVGLQKWKYDPWLAVIEGNNLYGRGSSDMKSGLAAMLMALLLIQRSSVSLKGNLWLAASAGEEVDCLGASAFIEMKRFPLQDGKPPAFVIGEPTGGKVFVAHKGTIWLKLRTLGRTAHGSTPQNGVNAIDKMRELLSGFSSLEWLKASDSLLGKPTFSVNRIEGGVASNVVPDRCEAVIDVRTLPSTPHDEIISSVETAIRRSGIEAELEIVNERSPVSTDVNDHLIHATLKAVQASTGDEAVPQGVSYYTDASVYQPALGAPVVIYGPGHSEMAHQPDENVSISSFLTSIEVYVRMALHYLGAEPQDD